MNWQLARDWVLVLSGLASLVCGLEGIGWAQGPTPGEKPLKDELPRILAIEPQDALRSFVVEKGFSLEIVASEPLLSDPVDACFDENGRMYVAEMHDYPFSHEPTKLNPKGGGKVGAGIVRLLEDTDGDGRMDKSSKFATGLSWPVSVAPFRGGVFVLAPPTLWYLKDTDGDCVADVKEAVFEGFNRDNVQAIANNLKWGLDHRIYAAGASNPSVLSRGGKEVLRLGRSDFSFDPRTYEVRAESGGVQWGHSFDDWGNRFVCSNSNHIQQVIFPQRYAMRNPNYTASGFVRSIGKEGGAGPVFRRSAPEPWRLVRTRRRVADPRFAGLPESERHPTGFFTSAAGVTIYRGAAYPELRGQAFVGDVGGNLVHRKLLAANGVGFIATRADEGAEFIASSDNWFRPCNFVNAPDGTLLILDMYRETIEHPASIPDDIKEYLNLYSGDDRGRVYRLLSPSKKRLPVERLGDLSTTELVARLESPNGWTRETAQRLIWERQDKSAIGELRRVAATSEEPLGRLHAAYSLEGLSVLSAEGVLAALHDKHPRVREHAVRLSEPFLKSSQAAFSKVVAELSRLADDDDVRVQFQVALSIGEATVGDSEAAAVLAKILTKSTLAPEVRSAALTSVPSDPSNLVAALATSQAENPQLDASAALRELAAMLGASSDSVPLMRTLNMVFEKKSTSISVKRVLLNGAANGLARRGVRVSDVAARVTPELLAFVVSETGIALSSKSAASERIAAIGTAIWATEAEATRLAELLTPAEPQAVQIAVVKTLTRIGTSKLPGQLLANWKGLSPSVRSEVLDALTQSAPRIEVLLAAVEKGEIRSAEINPDKRQLLLNHANNKVKELAIRVLGRDINADRAAVVKTYEAALALTGSVERGQLTFTKKCSQCHKFGMQGFAVGPDITSVQNKSPNDLLIAIMDPSREAQPTFTAYSVVTKQGLVFNGLIVAESAASITLRKAEGKEDIINRSAIEELVSSGKSLMPDGMEKELKEQDVADVITFIKSLGQSAGKK